MGLLDNMMTNPLAMASLGLLSMPTRSREPLNPIQFAMQGAMGAQRMQQMQAQQKMQEQQFGMQQQEFALKKAEAERAIKQRQDFDNYVASLTDPTQQQIARIAGPEAFGKFMIEQATPEAPQEFSRKEGDEIVTYRRDPKTLREVEVARAPRYKPAGTNVNVNAPGQMSSRPLTPEEVSAYGLTPEQAKYMMVDRFGELSDRPLAPGEKDRAKMDAETGQKNAELSRTYQVYLAAKKGLETGLSGTETGPLAGRIPPVTTGQQVGQGAVAAMAPVLKQIFRVAGEGTFTDQDQKLLLQMVPTRLDNPEARRQKLANIDAIIRAKLGIDSAPQPGMSGNSVRDSMQISPNQGGNVIDFNDL